MQWFLSKVVSLEALITKNVVQVIDVHFGMDIIIFQIKNIHTIHLLTLITELDKILSLINNKNCSNINSLITNNVRAIMKKIIILLLFFSAAVSANMWKTDLPKKCKTFGMLKECEEIVHPPEYFPRQPRERLKEND